MIKFKQLGFILIINSFLLMGYEKDHFFRFAESLEKNRLIHEAITEYQRFLFLNNHLNDLEKGKIWLRLAVCYRSINQEAEMMNAFNQVYRSIQHTSYIDELYEETIVYFLSRGKGELARIFINKLPKDKKAKKIDPYLCLSYLIEKEWHRFYSALKRLNITENQRIEVQKIVKKIKKNTKRIKLYKVFNIFFPGIVHGLYGGFLDTGETILFHYFFLQGIFSDSTLIGKLINGLGLTRLYLKTASRDRKFLREKLDEMNLLLEEEIFNIIINLK